MSRGQNTRRRNVFIRTLLDIFGASREVSVNKTYGEEVVLTHYFSAVIFIYVVVSDMELTADK